MTEETREARERRQLEYDRRRAAVDLRHVELAQRRARLNSMMTALRAELRDLEQQWQLLEATEKELPERRAVERAGRRDVDASLDS